MITTIQNTTPRRDTDGNIIDCHDGCLRYFQGRFYLYGTRYGGTDGFTDANRYVVYSSPDLAGWEAHGELLDCPLPGVSYRPYVVRHKTSGQYVMWFNWYPELWKGRFGVAVSDTPRGPFRVVNEAAKVFQPEPGDHNLFVDDDGTGYLIYTSIPGDEQTRHGMSVEKLDPGLTASTGENCGVFAHRVEAPAMFKHGGLYYCVFGNTCCFCLEGAGARVYRAVSPMGPWTFLGDINRDAGGRIIVPGQQTDIATIPTDRGDVYLWMSDLWGSRPDGVKGHDLQHWEAIRFDPDGTPMKLQGETQFRLSLP